MAWLINYMEPQISKTCFLPFAKDVWEVVKETYSDLGNAAQLFEIKTKLKETKQGSQSMTQYYSTLKNLWQGIDLFIEFEWSCPSDSAMC